jgi:hypothetical protein
MKESTFPARLSFRRMRTVPRPPFVKDEHGSVMVETAMSLAVWLTLVFGLMLLGLELYSYHFISEAARLGTRFAIVRGSTCLLPSGSSCTASVAQIQNYVTGLAYPGISSAAMTVTPTWYNSAGSTTNCPTCNVPGDYVQVKVQYQFPFSVPLAPRVALAMSSTSRMVISQ